MINEKKTSQIRIFFFLKIVVMFYQLSHITASYLMQINKVSLIDLKHCFLCAILCNIIIYFTFTPKSPRRWKNTKICIFGRKTLGKAFLWGIGKPKEITEIVLLHIKFPARSIESGFNFLRFFDFPQKNAFPGFFRPKMEWSLR